MAKSLLLREHNIGILLFPADSTGIMFFQDADLRSMTNDITKLLTKIDVSEADVKCMAHAHYNKRKTNRALNSASRGLVYHATE